MQVFPARRGAGSLEHRASDSVRLELAERAAPCRVHVKLFTTLTAPKGVFALDLRNICRI